MSNPTPGKQTSRRGRGHFFAIGKTQWQRAVDLGTNCAVAFLVMAAGTGSDNATTKWSAQAIGSYLGMAWVRAHQCILDLHAAGLVTVLTGGNRPKYSLDRPEKMEDMIWLPNSIVTGAGGASNPVKKLRQIHDVELLDTFIGLYAEQDLAADGGIPRDLIGGIYGRHWLGDYAEFTLWGFKSGASLYWHPVRVLSKYQAPQIEDGSESACGHLSELEKIGLLGTAVYLAESAESFSELIHPLTGDELADRVAASLSEMVEYLPEPFNSDHAAKRFEYVIPVERHLRDATLVVVYRLKFKPRTARTAAWWAKHNESCKQYSQRYRELMSRRDNVA